MRRHVALALTCAGVLLAGCGFGEGQTREGATSLRVTRDFGREQVGTARVGKVTEGTTVMRLLRSRFDVETRFGGRFVQAIDGISGKGASGREDWFFFVNGIEASVGAAEYRLDPGDIVQWDYRRWDGAMRVPAIVGAYPQPFTSGIGGRRRPVRVECADAGSGPCRQVKAALRALGVPATGSSIGTSGTTQVIRVLVAPWRRLRFVQAAALLEQAPANSGVFARFRSGGRALELLDSAGNAVRRAAPGTGLVAAVSPSPDEVVWLLTGVDTRGVAAAARALTARDLRDAYAVATTARGPVKLPLRGRS